jgi:hypothetical protein
MAKLRSRGFEDPGLGTWRAGFVKDSPVEKVYRNAKIGTIYEWTSFM